MPTLAFAMCGSFCTFEKALAQLALRERTGICCRDERNGVHDRYTLRHGGKLSRAHRKYLRTKNYPHHRRSGTYRPEASCRCRARRAVHGKHRCEGCKAVTDTAVTMAVKSALRVSMPVVLSLATNDALGASCKNIGLLMNTKNIYFVPLGQDDPIKKPNSLVAHFDLIPETLANARLGEQLQPVLR